jgi:hypothetical protein
VVPGEFGEFLPQPPGRDALRLLTSRDSATVEGRRRAGGRIVVAVELGQLASDVVADHSHDRFLAGQVGGGGERRILALRHDGQVIVQRQDAAPTGATVPVLSQAP